jgi:hypothetical protein
MRIIRALFAVVLASLFSAQSTRALSLVYEEYPTNPPPLPVLEGPLAPRAPPPRPYPTIPGKVPVDVPADDQIITIPDCRLFPCRRLRLSRR